MKYFIFKDPLNLSYKQLIAVFLSSCLILILAFAYEASQQYSAVKNSFDVNVDKLSLQQQQIEKRTDILLDALSQYYATNSSLTNNEFEHFAKGLYNQSETIHAIGFAPYELKRSPPTFKNLQQPREFEFVQAQKEELAKEESLNTQEFSLPISQIIPLDAKHMLYLNKDLFSLPGIAKQFQKATESNQSHIELLQSSRTKIFYTLSFKPVYKNDPEELTDQERLQQVKGIVFIILPIEEIIFNKIKKLFPQRNVFFNAPLNTFNSPLFSQMVDPSNTNSSLKNLLELYLYSPFSFVSSQPETQFNLEQHWHLKNLAAKPLIITLYITLAIYLALILFSIMLYRHTRHLQQTQIRLTRIIDTSQEAVIVTDKEGLIKVWNPIAIQLFGYSEQEALNKPIIKLIFDPSKTGLNIELKQQFLDAFGLKQTNSNHLKQELQLITRENKKITAEVATSIINNPKNLDDIEVSFFIKDISYQRQTEAEIKQLAYFDPLTNLENRTYFKSQVEKTTQESPPSFAILFLDLDGFKQVNDSLGHSVGDELLVVIAKRITNALQQTHICRFGGDEFVLMLKDVTEEQAAQVSLRLLKTIERLVKLKNDELKISGSIGIALYPDHGQDVDTLLRHADTAMYQSKNLGKNTYSIYNNVMEERLSKRLLLEKNLRNAISNNEFSLVYQPKIDVLSGQVTGVEALIRWSNPTLGFVPPDEFIFIAEESNLIIDIGNWVAKTAIQQLKAWKNTKNNALHIAINVSSHQLQHPNFLRSLSQAMQQEDLAPNLLEIELTERTIMSNAEENILRFNDIRDQGFELSVDDFGTGYSSLSYLKKFPLNIIKIDKSFIDGLPMNEDDVSIAKAILSLSHNLNMIVVAEGVENREQLQFLKTLNCNLAQGYYISRPLSSKKLDAWLANNNHNFYDDHEVL